MPTFRRKKSALPARNRSSAVISDAHTDAFLHAAATRQLSAPLVNDEQPRDICSSMFETCRQCQDAHLDPLGATCMFDVDGGEVPVWMFDVLRAIVEMVVADIAASATSRVPGGAVGITLRHSGAFWALAIAENITGETGAKRAARRLTMVRALTDRLDCVCRILPNAWGSTIAIAFPDGPIEHNAHEHSAPGGQLLH